MKGTVRRFTFTSEVYNNQGESAILKADYDVTFHRYEAKGRTYCTIIPDFGPTKELQVVDVGITWKSLFRAWQWCAKHANAHLAAWVEMDLKSDTPFYNRWNSGVPVIPDKKLSTARKIDDTA